MTSTDSDPNKAPHAPHHHHGHSHNHGHNHTHGHNHSCPATQASQTRLLLATILTGTFMFAEVLGGIISGSLALLADAGHMLMDFTALMAAWVSFKLADRPKTPDFPDGLVRLPTLTAFVSSLSLVFIGICILVQAAIRLFNPAPIMANSMLVVAIVGLLINAIVFWILIQGDRDNLNMRAAILHVMGDFLGSIAAIIAAVIILMTGWYPADTLLSSLVALFIISTALPVIKQSAKLLLRGPEI